MPARAPAQTEEPAIRDVVGKVRRSEDPRVRGIRGAPVRLSGATARIGAATPLVRGEVRSLGGPTREPMPRTRRIVVRFPFDGASPVAADAARLKRFIEGLDGVVRVRADGHTDHFGDHPYNDALSWRRAAYVCGQVAEHLDVTCDVRPHGEHDPLRREVRPDQTDDPRARARNRRVEVAVWLDQRRR